MTTKLSTECHWSQDSEDGDVWAIERAHGITATDAQKEGA